MPETLTPEQAEARAIVTEKSAGFASVYANNVTLTVTPWDFKFAFGVIKEASVTELRTEEKVEVYMSPQQAKSFLRVLALKVKEYHTHYGVDKIQITKADEPEGEE